MPVDHLADARRHARRAKLHLEARDKAIVAAHDAGFSQGQIAAAVGISQPGVLGILRRHGR